MSIDTKTWAGYFKDILVINFLFYMLKYCRFEGFKKLSVDACFFCFFLNLPISSVQLTKKKIIAEILGQLYPSCDRFKFSYQITTPDTGAL